MNASLLAVLNDAERLLVAQTERAELAALDELLAPEVAACGRIMPMLGSFMARPMSCPRAFIKVSCPTLARSINSKSNPVALPNSNTAGGARHDRRTSGPP